MWAEAEEDPLESDNFLQHLSETVANAHETDSCSESGEVGDFTADFVFRNRNANQALPASWTQPICAECRRVDRPGGGGRYGTDDHQGIFFCGSCWKAWDQPEQANIMKPLYMQRREKDAHHDFDSIVESDNFFDQFEVDAGVDDVVGGWENGQASTRYGEMALPISFEAPKCTQCGQEDGEGCGGRYKQCPEGFQFFCGRCWKSWSVDARNSIMMAYTPSCSVAPCCPPPVAETEPMFNCSPTITPDLGEEFQSLNWRKDGDDMHVQWDSANDEDDLFITEMRSGGIIGAPRLLACDKLSGSPNRTSQQQDGNFHHWRKVAEGMDVEFEDEDFRFGDEPSLEMWSEEVTDLSAPQPNASICRREDPNYQAGDSEISSWKKTSDQGTWTLAGERFVSTPQEIHNLVNTELTKASNGPLSYYGRGGFDMMKGWLEKD